MENNIAFFNLILRTRARSVIEARCHDVIIAGEFEEADRAVCFEILKTTRLDQMYVLCHERLIELHQQKAQQLRDFLARK